MLSKSMTAVGHASAIRQHLNDLEGHTFNYVPVFGEEVAAQASLVQDLSAMPKCLHFN